MLQGVLRGTMSDQHDALAGTTRRHVLLTALRTLAAACCIALTARKRHGDSVGTLAFHKVGGVSGELAIVAFAQPRCP